VPSRTLEKLEYMVSALPLLDTVLQEFRDLLNEEMMEGSAHMVVDLDLNQLRFYLYPEVRLVLAYGDGHRDKRDVIPLFVIVPEYGFRAEIADKRGLSVVNDFIDELRIDDVSSTRLALSQLEKEVAMKTTGSNKQKGNRLLNQLKELLIPTAA